MAKWARGAAAPAAALPPAIETGWLRLSRGGPLRTSRRVRRAAQPGWQACYNPADASLPGPHRPGACTRPKCIGVNGARPIGLGSHRL